MSQTSVSPHIVWVYPGTLANVLDAATWLETTRALRQFGWRVTLVVAGPANQHYVRGVEVLCLPRPDMYLLRQLVFHGRLLWFILKQWAAVDVILFHPMSSPWLLPLRLLRNMTSHQRPLLVLDIRSLHMPSKDRFKDRLREAFQKFMRRESNRWVDGYLVITQRMASSLCIPAERLWGVWPSGVNLEQFASAETIRHWPLLGEPIHLIYIGALHYERNLLALCQAVEQANTEGMAFRLILLGEGTERAALEKFAGQSGGQICVRPPVPHDQVPQILAQAHVGVLPFPDEEKFRVSSPIKLFEYMAAGLAILATRIPCHTDVVGKGKYVFWAEQSNLVGLLAALYQVWQNREVLNIAGAQSAVAATDWTWRASAQKLKLSLERKLIR